MEKEKYYTPDISEYHVGFEYEWKCDGTQTDWTKSVCDEIMNPLDVDCRRINEYRIKYLDNEDIESFGFHSINETKFKSNSNKIITIELIENNKIFIEEIILIDTIGHEESYTLFNGIIKNKSELKFILKRLKIISNG